MVHFQTIRQGRIHVHVLSTKQFRTRHMSVKLVRPLSRERVTPSAVLPYLWLEGTTSRPTAADIMRHADDLFGSVIRTGVSKRGDHHVAEIFASVPEETKLSGAGSLFAEVQNLVLELLLNPLRGDDGFDVGNVERERALHRKRIESLFDDKIAFALERCVAEMCKGETHGLPRLGYLEDLDALTASRLWTTYEEWLRHADVHIYLVGNFADGAAVGEGLFEALSHRLPSPSRSTPWSASVAAPRDGEVRRVVDEQDVAQGKVNIGYRTGVSYRHPQFLPLMVCNGVLGGFPHSKLFVNVREKESLAYYASSRLDALSGLATIQTGIQIENFEQALEIILKQVKDVQEGFVSDEELAFTLRGLRNQYLQLLDQPVSMMEVHFNGVLAGIHREVSDILSQLDSITVADVVDVARQWRLDTIYFLRNREEKVDA